MKWRKSRNERPFHSTLFREVRRVPGSRLDRRGPSRLLSRKEGGDLWRLREIRVLLQL